MKPILVVKTGSALPGVLARHGDFEDWFREIFGAQVPLRVVRVFEGESLPLPEEAAAILVTGSAAMVTAREAWSEAAAAWLADAVLRDAAPVLGICYGHQLLAHGLGGKVGVNPRGREMGTMEIEFLQDGPDPLLGSLVGATPFQTSHLESVLELPPGARRLGQSRLDPNHVFRVGERAWGIQFHPEFDAPIMRSYVDERAEGLQAEGIDPGAIQRAVRPTPGGPALLRLFAQIALDGGAR